MNNKARGTRVEIQVLDDLGARGYDVVRSAASKTAADLVALHDGQTLLVQVKMGPKNLVSPAERRELLRMAGRCGALAIVSYKITDPDDARKSKIVYRQLTGQGHREWIWFAPRPHASEEVMA